MHESLLRFEAALALSLAWVLVFWIPFRHTSLLFGGAASPSHDGSTVADTRRIARAIGIARRLERVASQLP